MFLDRRAANTWSWVLRHDMGPSRMCFSDPTWVTSSHRNKHWRLKMWAVFRKGNLLIDGVIVPVD